MAEPRIWFDPPAFSWSRVLRIGLLWSAAVLMVLVPAMQPVDEQPPAPAADPAILLVQQPAGAATRAASVPGVGASGSATAR